MARRLRRLTPANRLEGLDGLRAIAALAIFGHHVGFASAATFTSPAGGLLARLDIGVPVFFVLSGFLMFRPIVVSIVDGAALRPAVDHLWRRALRVYPAFWAALALIVVFTSEGLRDAGAALSTAALVHIHWPGHVIGPMPHAWSLATEISFYAALPVLARLLRPLIQGPGRSRRRADRVAGLFAAAAGLYLLSVFFRLWMHGLANDWTPAAVLWLPAMIDYFAVGMALAVAHAGLRDGTPARARLDRLAAPAGLWWLGAAVLFAAVAEGLGLARGLAVASWPREMLRQQLYGVIGFALLFPLVFGRGLRGAGGEDGGGLVRRLSSGRILAGLGRISYSFYLWHMVFIVHPWAPAQRAVERVWDATVRAGWFDAAAGWSGAVSVLDSRFVLLAAAALGPTLAAAAASYWAVERAGQSAARLVRRPVRDPAPLESLAAGLARRWRAASLRAQFGVIAGLAAAVRIAYVLAAKRTESILEPDSVLPGDQFYYSLAGEAIADGDGFVVPWHGLSIALGLAEPGSAAPHAADHPPLTALAAAAAGWLPGGAAAHELAQRLTMAALGVAAVILVGLAGHAAAGRRAGLAAAAIAALYAGFWVNDGLVMSETLVAVTVAGTLWSALRYRRSPVPLRAVELGAWAALAALARSEMLLLAALVAVPAVWSAHPQWRGRLTRGAAAAAVAALLLAPWVIPNLVRFENPVLMSTNVGLTLAGANNALTYSGGAIGFWSLEQVEATVDVAGLDQSEASAAYRAAAADYALDHAERWPAVAAARLGRVWSVYRPLQMIDWNQGEGREPWASMLALAGYALLVPAAVGGWLMLRRSGSVAAWLLAAPFVHVSVVAVAFYGLPRLRVPAEVALVVLAAIALSGARPSQQHPESATPERPAGGPSAAGPGDVSGRVGVFGDRAPRRGPGVGGPGGVSGRVGVFGDGAPRRGPGEGS